MKSLNRSYISLIYGTLLILIAPAYALAQQNYKVVLHINDPRKMTMLVNNVTNLRQVLGKSTEIVVIVNGPAVARFSNLSTSRSQLDTILQQDASVNICSYALKNKRIDKEQLFKGVTYLEDGGVAKLVELQDKGYAYIKP